MMMRLVPLAGIDTKKSGLSLEIAITIQHMKAFTVENVPMRLYIQLIGCLYHSPQNNNKESNCRLVIYGFQCPGLKQAAAAIRQVNS